MAFSMGDYFTLPLSFSLSSSSSIK